MIAPYDMDAKNLSSLRAQNTPTVVIDRRVEGWEVDTVHVDSIAGARSIVQHLIRYGEYRSNSGMFLTDQLLSEGLQPTVVSQSAYGMCVNVAQLILSRINTRVSFQPRHVILPARLIALFLWVDFKG
jgi:DNA-binding LacI/PurR family transcriptional regulator